MILSLVGMSNVGKSYWAKRLEEEQGFRRFSCDELIARKLSVDDLSGWMGMPFHNGFPAREAHYLSLETQVLSSILDQVDEAPNTVIDTTGSVVYLLKILIDRLKFSTRIIYLKAHESDLSEMVEQFFEHPKPVVWGDVFSTCADESHEQALRRCYPALLTHRASRYDAMAHVTIPRQRLRSNGYSTDQFLYDVLQYQR